jgi:hypothetical protein
MPATTATLDLSIWRNDDVYEFPLRVIGPNLTGVSVRAQVRIERDTPGAPLVALELVTNGNAEGIRLASATLVDGRWINDLRVRLNKSTRQALPYSGELGDATALRWALAIAGRTRIDGKVLVLGHTLDSDNAPLGRPASYGGSTYGLGGDSMPTSGATLTIAADSVAELVIDGADLVAAETVKAQTAATQSTTGADRSTREADRAALFASTALGAIGGTMYPTMAAGLAAASQPPFFSVAGDSTSTFAILYERINDGASYDFSGGVLPAGATLTRAAGPWSRTKPDKQMEIGSAADVARFDYDPVTGAFRGLLVEPSRTNVALRSAELNATDAWFENATTVTANVATAPDGTMTADRVAYQSPSQARQEQGIGANLNPATVSIYSLAQTGTPKFRFVGNLNVDFTATASWSRSSLPFVLNSGGGNASIYNGSAGGTNTLLFWGYQVEAGATPTSYIPTTTAAATRPADVLTLDWARKGAANGPITVRYTFDDGSTQDANVTVVSGKATVDPTTLARFSIRSVKLMSAAAGPIATERARYASKAAYEGATGAALIGTKRGNLQKVLDRQPMFAGDYGVVGDGVTDDTVAAQAFIDACYAAGRRTANFGSMCCKISGPLYASFVGIVFEPFGYGDSPSNSSGFYVVERPDGVPYTALTVTGFVADMNVSVFGTGTVEGDANHNVTRDTRPRVNGVALGRPDGATQLAASTIRGIRTYMLRGFGVKETNVFDTLIQNISIEYCGSEVEYAYSVQGDGNATGTVNESVHLRVQVEFAVYQAIYISPFTLSVGFLNIHSERAIAHPSYRTWFFGGSIKIQNIRLDAFERGKASIKFLSNQMSVEMLRADDIPCEIDPTGGVINMLNCAGRFIPTTASNGRVNFSGAIGRFEQVKAGWVISGSAVSYLSVAEMGDEQFAVVRDSEVAVVESSATSTQGNLRVHGTSIASLTTSGMRSFKALDGSRCTLKGGVQQMAYQKIAVDATSRLIGNVVLDSCGMRLDGVIQGDMNYAASRQALIGDRAVVTGGVANNGPPESGAYLDGLYDGMVTKNPKPVVGNPKGWMYAGGQWRSLGSL